MSLGAVLTAIVTPFDDDLAVDEQAFVDLMHHLRARLDGFVVCASTGEPSTLRSAEHLRVVDWPAETGPGRRDRGQHRVEQHRHSCRMTAAATELGATRSCR